MANNRSVDNMETNRFYICFFEQRKRSAEHSHVTANTGELANCQNAMAHNAARAGRASWMGRNARR